ncbi:MAG: fibro-slime domain-containing protein [Deltaproteobacteria bacterium]|nr:fibro-slime domain-containing protein [Deltaproteobacteria bacterium]MBW2536806.1 fibro-slime domain-containing protein [Deltaproteobacteria bacterium]
MGRAMRPAAAVAVGCLAVGLLACSSSSSNDLGPGTGTGSASGGTGGGINLGASGGAGGGGLSGTGGDNGICNTQMTGRIRDFQSSHPDFEGTLGDDRGFVGEDLGSDEKPVYAGPAGGTLTTSGPDNFDQWYRDTDGVNQGIPLTINLEDAGGGVYTYNNPDFFPIDGEGFGNEGNPHNYHFTYELRASFVYQGGEVFTFTGDDDLFTFINHKLAIDLGGVHGPETDTIDLDDRASDLGIEPGETYDLHFFFAERHTVLSNFRIDTTIAFIDCGPPPPE